MVTTISISTYSLLNHFTSHFTSPSPLLHHHRYRFPTPPTPVSNTTTPLLYISITTFTALLLPQRHHYPIPPSLIILPSPPFPSCSSIIATSIPYHQHFSLLLHHHFSTTTTTPQKSPLRAPLPLAPASSPAPHHTSCAVLWGVMLKLEDLLVRLARWLVLVARLNLVGRGSSKHTNNTHVSSVRRIFWLSGSGEGRGLATTGVISQ